MTLTVNTHGACSPGGVAKAVVPFQAKQGHNLILREGLSRDSQSTTAAAAMGATRDLLRRAGHRISDAFHQTKAKATRKRGKRRPSLIIGTSQPMCFEPHLEPETPLP